MMAKCATGVDPLLESFACGAHRLIVCAAVQLPWLWCRRCALGTCACLRVLVHGRCGTCVHGCAHVLEKDGCKGAGCKATRGSPRTCRTGSMEVCTSVHLGVGKTQPLPRKEAYAAHRRVGDHSRRKRQHPLNAVLLPSQIVDRSSGRVSTSPWCLAARGVLKCKEKNGLERQFCRKTACSSCAQPWLLAIGSWRLVAIGSWRLAVGGGWWWWAVIGGWWLVAVGCGWRFAVGHH